MVPNARHGAAVCVGCAAAPPETAGHSLGPRDEPPGAARGHAVCDCYGRRHPETPPSRGAEGRAPARPEISAPTPRRLPRGGLQANRRAKLRGRSPRERGDSSPARSRPLCRGESLEFVAGKFGGHNQDLLCQVVAAN
eukprot:8716296-Pyramimonas_sp.AAC.1